MKKATGISLLILFLSSPMLKAALTNVQPLTSEEISVLDQNEISDARRFPHFVKAIKGISGLRQAPPEKENEWLVPKWALEQNKVYWGSREIWDTLFSAAVKDRMTVLRMFSIIGREIKKLGFVMYGPGKPFMDAVRDNNIDLGLAIPAKNVGLAVWASDPYVKDPNFMIHLNVFYDCEYRHIFPDEILPASLKIGTEDTVTYKLDGRTVEGHPLYLDIYNGNGMVGFKNVRGVSGRKKGVLGFFQDVLFFLPDAVNAMLIDEKNDKMITEALINTEVKDFETNPVYAISSNSL